MNPLKNIIFVWSELTNKEKKIVIATMDQEDIDLIKEFRDKFDSTVITMELTK